MIRPKSAFTCISIHALHEESDHIPQYGQRIAIRISIHALHEESDDRWWQKCSRVPEFQSTLSMRRATETFR